jgi:SAM-dependent methyltransferase
MGILRLAKKTVPSRWRRRVRAMLCRAGSVCGTVSLYRAFRKDLRAYRQSPGAERVEAEDLWPCIFDKTGDHPFDAQYFYQDSWATRRILATRPREHIDVASRVDFVGILSASVPVTFVDCRPLNVNLPNLKTIAGSILRLPFADSSVPSLSCLHVIEHIGLGRYGDPLDPEGTKKAAAELVRVLAPGGSLFVGAPVGRERVCFNAHRVHLPKTILAYFAPLKLVEFSCVVGEGVFHEDVDPLTIDLGFAACGLFWFRKEKVPG